MKTVLFDYPKSASFGRVLPKSKIYEHARPSTAVKQLFVRQVEKIVWQYKLAPETVNMKPTRTVPEIQVFRIALKTGELKHVVLHCIDQAIPFPILYELWYEGKIQVVASYKRPSEADSSKWLVSDYFESVWLSSETPRPSLPVVLDLETLYAQILTALMPFPAREGEELQAQVGRMEQIRSKQRELAKYETRLHKEKQFNRKVAINTDLRKLKADIRYLTRRLATVVL
ncbi:MAG TPA: DUF4391 domain-containing protein [Bacteroidetes bacterium]|nr:DUF4391 domain-containing protein [Bacteroidota bacterium]HEX05033.1 DUF4391 domain-containing protein [Bacteroidota bacterium]